MLFIVHQTKVILLKQLLSTFQRLTLTISSFVFLYGLEQLMNHILTTFAKRVSQQDIIDVGLSNHQLIYRTIKSPHSYPQTNHIPLT